MSIHFNHSGIWFGLLGQKQVDYRWNQPLNRIKIVKSFYEAPFNMNRGIWFYTYHPLEWMKEDDNCFADFLLVVAVVYSCTSMLTVTSDKMTRPVTSHPYHLQPSPSVLTPPSIGGKNVSRKNCRMFHGPVSSSQVFYIPVFGKSKTIE